MIIDAIRESRKTFQRMTNYSIYRIAETIALLGFLTLAIVVFDFYPVTAIMIVLLAILNDGAILSIAYDNVRHSDKPESWNMRLVLGIATILGIYAVVRSFGIFYIGDRVFGHDNDTLRTLVYLNLAVGGIFTLLSARVRGPFWSMAPAPILLVATIGAMLVATFIAVYGLSMEALGWKWAGLVWGYCLGLFLLQDQVKLMAYRVFDRGHSGILTRAGRA